MAKNQRDTRKIFTKIMATILALLMVVGMCGTLIYYVVASIIAK